ncbi:hypothetical protein MY1884_000371 [Beauveria asiatica]
MADVPMYVISENASSERRITPSWSIDTFRTKLEPITGIPPSSQRLSLKSSKGAESVALEAADEENTPLSSFALAAYGEIHVLDTRPAGMRVNFNDTSGVEKYVMPEGEYEKKTDSVLAWKRAQKLGRFDPNAPNQEHMRVSGFEQEIGQRGITVGKRCRVGGEDTRRGVVKYVGEVAEIPNGAGPWIGVHLDEPVGKNDGSIAGKRYWGEDSTMKHGIFVRPERIEVGEFPAMDDLEDMEEI